MNRLSLAATVALCLSGTLAAQGASIFIVTTAVDEDDGNPDPGNGTGTSLREAISAANAESGSTIFFDAALNGVPILLSIEGFDDANVMGDLDITSDVTITGNGAGLTIVDGNGFDEKAPDRVFHIVGFNDCDESGRPCPPPLNVEISGLTIQGGTNIGGLGGGGILVEQSLLLLDCILTGNHSTVAGGALRGASGLLDAEIVDIQNTHFIENTCSRSGGAISNLTVMNVSDCSFTDNESTGVLFQEGGGAIFNNAPMTLIRSTVSSNMASNRGGGIANLGGPLTMDDSTVSGNEAGLHGGGIWSIGTQGLTVRNSTVSGNTALGNGGGIENGFHTNGNQGVTHLIAATITDNTATVGGGVSNEPTFVTNVVNALNSIIAGNTATRVAPDFGGAVTSMGHNLVQDTSDSSGFGGTDVLGFDPLLGPLQDNFGPTETHELLTGSPAIDAGADLKSLGITTDQRGARRPTDQGGVLDATNGTDIGAFELCNLFDDDGDGHFAPGACFGPDDDCDDSNDTVFGGAPELCDGLDNDCNELIDDIGGGVDCDSNGIPDDCDIDQGNSKDSDGDGVLDLCDQCPGFDDATCIDCNGNGVPDDIDVGGKGSSADCDGNGVPDECQFDDDDDGVIDECDVCPGFDDATCIDCNGNGVPDDIDVSGKGVSADCDGNGVPDECQPDSDRDGVIDACDVCPGFDDKTCIDCNGNGVPDEIDVGDKGGSEDCDGNGVPDECQPDSDRDGVIDECDVCPGFDDATCIDCNGNGVPDDIDVSGKGVSADCDENGVPDECQPDSDRDGVIDACDACPGFDDKTCIDCNGNGVPDEIDVGVKGGSADCDGNDVPDECQPDSDGDGVIDACDTCPGFDDNVDSDDDGVADGCDGCPDDPLKSDPGACGCGVPDVDSDGDGVPDCNDVCPGLEEDDCVLSVAQGDNQLRSIDPFTAATLRSVPLSLDFATINGANGLATHPITGEVYALVRASFGEGGGGGNRSLVTVDVTTGHCTLINVTDQPFAGIAFGPDGTLFAVTGNGGSSPESLFILSRSHGSSSYICELGNGTAGEALATSGLDGRLYHASGHDGDDEVIFEVIGDPFTDPCAVTNIDITGTPLVNEEVQALTFWPAQGVFLWKQNHAPGPLFRVAPDGSSALVGILDHQAKGLTFSGVADCNDNGIPDATELGEDCNRNGVLDDCEPDLNDNGLPDSCEGSAVSYCETSPNSFDPFGALIEIAGSLSVIANNMELLASPVPNSTGLFYFGSDQTNSPFGLGRRCVEGQVIRLTPALFAVNNLARKDLDFTNASSGESVIVEGSTWNFQYWFRDSPTEFNLSNAIEVTFAP